VSKKGRKKASDVFRETPYVFPKVPFKEAFPQIKSAKVTVEETGDFGLGLYSPKSRVRKFDETTLGEFIDCSNPLCYNGGFSICQILWDMMQKKETHFETLESCQGFEGSRKFKSGRRRCLNKFKVTIDVEYSPAA
jgi:hypothetical protein